MKVRWLIAMPVALGALMLVACGGSSDNSKSTAGPTTKAAAASTPAATARAAATAPAQAARAAIDACKLVTKAEAEAASGATVGEPKPESAANLYTCRFEDTAPPNVPVVAVSVLAGIRDGDAKEVFDIAKKNGNDPQTVADLGDDAFWDDVLHSLNIVKGNYMLSVDVNLLQGGDPLTVAKTLAGTALGRLP